MSDRESLSAQSIVVRNVALMDAEIDGEVVALNVDRGTCHGLNKVGSRIWKMLAEPRRVSDVCASLVSEYEVDDETCERQVLDLLDGLRRTLGMGEIWTEHAII